MNVGFGDLGILITIGILIAMYWFRFIFVRRNQDK